MILKNNKIFKPILVFLFFGLVVTLFQRFRHLSDDQLLVREAMENISNGKTSIQVLPIRELSLSNFKISNTRDTLYFNALINEKKNYSGFYINNRDTVMMARKKLDK